jgi:precorrin-6A/cobalt-precorrin-6A reductase
MDLIPSDGPLELLILGGTTEAAELARRVAEAYPGLAARVSLAGRTQAPKPLALPTRIGGFGGVEGLARYLRESGVKMMVDATHPFAAVMPFHAAEACRSAGIPLIALRRPGWEAVPGDRWIPVPDMGAATRALGETPRRVFLTIGRQELVAFAAAPEHAYLARTIDLPEEDLGLSHLTLVQARGPFTVDDEIALMRGHNIEVVVTKNAGGMATSAKLAAARALGLPVIMVERPAKPDVPTVETVEAALERLKPLLPADPSLTHGALATERGV